MGFLNDTFKTLDGIGQDIKKYANYTTVDFGKAFESVRYDFGKHIHPSALEPLKNFGEEAGKYVGTTADNIWKALMGASEGFSNYTGPTAHNIVQGLDGFGHEVRGYFGNAMKDAQMIELGGVPTDIRQWVEQHPGQTAMIIAGIVSIPVSMAAVPSMLSTVGFTARGINAGSIAASIQSNIGNVAADSLFATLMSAGQAGYGLAAIHGIVGGITSVVTISANALGLTAAASKGHTECHCNSDNES